MTWSLTHVRVRVGNILWRPKHLEWTLIDFGCAAQTGALHIQLFLPSVLGQLPPIGSLYHDTNASALQSAWRREAKHIRITHSARIAAAAFVLTPLASGLATLPPR